MSALTLAGDNRREHAHRGSPRPLVSAVQQSKLTALARLRLVRYESLPGAAWEPASVR
jgi:hypothetical protein